MNSFKGIIISVALICFAGGAFFMENWHAEKSELNAADIKKLNQQLLEIEERQVEFIERIDAHHLTEAEYMALVQQDIEDIKKLIYKHDSGGL